MNHPHAYDRILEDYFFSQLDQGLEPENTPLVWHKMGKGSLVPLVQQRFNLTAPEARGLLEAAVVEISL
jgi:hypothetical protein